MLTPKVTETARLSPYGVSIPARFALVGSVRERVSRHVSLGGPRKHR
jgi:hypothetical protein